MTVETISKTNPYSLEYITSLVPGGTDWRICSTCGVEFSRSHIGHGTYGMCSVCTDIARHWKQFCEEFGRTGENVLTCSECGILFFHVWGKKGEKNLCSMGYRGYSSSHYPHPIVCRQGRIPVKTDHDSWVGRWEFPNPCFWNRS